jgi:hypothetical protein
MHLKRRASGGTNMKKSIVRAALAASLIASSLMPNMAMAGSKDFAPSGYQLPADKPVSIILMRPDVRVGQLEVGGVVTPKAEWTDEARKNLQVALKNNQSIRKATIIPFDQDAAETAQMASDYEYLHRAVAASILQHKYFGAKLPTKKEAFDWSLGSGVAPLGQATSSNYALFLYVEDSFSSDARKATQVVGALGCLVGFCVIRGGGIHRYYASLVELETGNIVWFNVLRGSEGDVREEKGAQGMVDALLASMPVKPGQSTVATTKKKK